MVAAARSPKVGEWTRPGDERRCDGEGRGEASVEESNHATVPLRQAPWIGDLKKRVQAVPSEERAEHCQRQRTGVLIGSAQGSVRGHGCCLAVVEANVSAGACGAESLHPQTRAELVLVSVPDKINKINISKPNNVILTTHDKIFTTLHKHELERLKE